MKKKQLNWEEIMQDSAEVMMECIKNGTENMVHFGLLYRKKQKENK